MELRIYTRMLKVGWWIIALTTLAAVNIALAVSYLAPPQYRATAKLLVTPNTAVMEQQYDMVDSLRALDTPTIVNTYAELLQSDRIFQEASGALNADPIQLKKDYKTAAVVLPDSSVIQVSSEGPSPQIAASLVNGMSQRAIDYVDSAYQVYNLGFLDYAAIPDEPFSPQPLRNVAVALVLGLVLGSVLAIVREQLRTTLDGLFQQRRFDNVSMALNRRFFQRQLENAIADQSTTLSLALIHFDGLRDMLDTLPRAVTQELLRRLTQILKNELRGNDQVGRWSDTEFAVMLPDTPGTGATRVLERIRARLQQPFQLEDGESVTLQPSVGVAVRRNGETPDTVVEHTESALKEARQDPSRQTVLYGAN